MERTSPSMSYSDLQNTLDDGFAEQRHRDLWLFLYSSRHAHVQLWQPPSPKDLNVQKSNQLIDKTFLLLEKFSPFEPWRSLLTTEELAAELNEFCFGITYAFHKSHLADGFIDIRFEEQIALYDVFINKLTCDEIAVVSRLHDLTYKYGFLITELWRPLIRSVDLIEAFIIKNLKIKDIDPIPSFVFTKKGSHPRGIQISTKEYQRAISEPWDLAVFINKNDNLSKIKENISNSWPRIGNQFIGDCNKYEIAFYVDRDKCKISNALSAIRLQIDQINDYTNGLTVLSESEDLGSSGKNKTKAKKEMRRRLSSKIDRLRLSEGLLSKRWSIEKSNVRRCIGLYLWDQMNIVRPSRKSRKPLIADLIEQFKIDKPEVLNFYLRNFNKYNSPTETTKFGDTVESLETVIREMEADLYLTECCIKNFEYLTPSDAKHGGK